MSKGLEETIFKDDYLREKALLYVDNLNILYVAFTRAVEVLCIYTPEFDEEGVKNNVASLIVNSIKNQYFEIEKSNFPAVFLPEYVNEDASEFNFGNLPVKENKPTALNELMVNLLPYPVRAISDVTRQVITATEYFQGGPGLASHLNFGKVLHEVFQYIKTPDDVDRALLKVYSDGKITGEDRKNIELLIREVLTDEKVKTWFASDWTVKTEASILLPDKSLHRPDRVMIKGKKAIVVDYKFGDEESAVYKRQVAQYMRYLSQMGYVDIEGYLWYVNQKKIVPVIAETGQGRLFD
jgi:ATP-dependent exoDNAse (exonuclease V) beta subunit